MTMMKLVSLLAMMMMITMTFFLPLADGISVSNKAIANGWGSSSLLHNNNNHHNIVRTSPTTTRREQSFLCTAHHDDIVLENINHPIDNNVVIHNPSSNNRKETTIRHNYPWREGEDARGLFCASRVHSLDVMTRRRGGTMLVGLLTGMGYMSGSFAVPPKAAAIADGTLVGGSSSTTTPIVSTGKEILSRLAGIPTFCIVDGTTGVPYMIYDGSSASATGYFFLSFQVAKGVLRDARDKDPLGKDVWEAATITVVPLSVALQMTLSKRQRRAVNGGGGNETRSNNAGDDRPQPQQQYNTFADIIPSEEGVADAKALPKSLGQNPDKWSQKGRVPLFYIEGLALPSSSSSTSKLAGMEPRYFNVQDLVREWQTQNLSDDGTTTTIPPPIKVVELIELYRAAATKNDWSTLANIVIMPVQESNKVAVELMRAQRASSSSSSGGMIPPYSIDKVFLVGSSK
jgi:hypothetical protein